MREGGGCRSRSREEGGGGGGGRLECTEAGVAAHRSLGEVSDHKGRAHIGEAEQRGAQVPVGGVQGAPGEGREEPGGLGQPATPHTEGGGGGGGSSRILR